MIRPIFRIAAAWAAIAFFSFSLQTVSGEDLLSATIERLSSDLKFFSSDQLQGRDSGSEGIRKAAEFAAERFRQLGLQTDIFEGSPFQEFTIDGLQTLGEPERNQLAFVGIDGLPQPELYEDFVPLSLGSSGKFSGELVFVGYGISAPDYDYDDYEGIDVEGKIVVMLRKEPRQDDPESPFDGKEPSSHARFATKEANAGMHKAAAILMVNDAQTAAGDDGDRLPTVGGAGRAVSKVHRVPTLFCKRALVDKIVHQGIGLSLAELEDRIDADLKPLSQPISGITVTGETAIETKVRNVVALLPGSGELVDEYLVVGAHYDHVGLGGRGSLAPGTIEIHNGADDNGSGTSVVLEVARRLAEVEATDRRNVVFMLFTAEEKGLLGSKHYVRNPRWPLEDTVAMLNMDMVGRLTENHLTIYGTGTAERFDALVDEVNQTYGFSLSKNAAGYGPSDHSSFYGAGIPVFHFFTGLHNDYHRPSDDFEKVNFDGMARIAGMVTDIATDIMTKPQRPVLIESKERAKIDRSAARRKRGVMGIRLDVNQEQPTISALVADGPAEGAGLQIGDAVKEIDGTKLDTIKSLLDYLANRKPGEKIKVLVLRASLLVEVEVELAEQ